jgi:hypothetical protein
MVTGSSYFKPVANRLPSVYEAKDRSTPLLNTANYSPTQPSSSEKLDDLTLAKQHYFGRGSNLDLKRAFQLFSNLQVSGDS